MWVCQVFFSVTCHLWQKCNPTLMLSTRPSLSSACIMWMGLGKQCNTPLLKLSAIRELQTYKIWKLCILKCKIQLIKRSEIKPKTAIKPTQQQPLLYNTWTQFFTIVWSAKKSSLALCWASRNTDNKGLFMMRLLHTEPQKTSGKKRSIKGWELHCPVLGWEKWSRHFWASWQRNLQKHPIFH